MSWSWEFAAEILPELLQYFVRVTLLVTLIGTAIAAGLGLIVAIVTRVLPKFAALPIRWVMDFIRMTPLPIQLLFIYVLFSPPLSPVQVGIIVIGVHYSTYMAESYRAGIESIRQGQWEAATALSLPKRRTWQAVILPQAIRATLPSLGNWGIAMFKDTPFLIIIGAVEMVTRAQTLGDRTFNYVEPFTIAGLIFLAASYPIAILMRKLEDRLAYK